MLICSHTASVGFKDTHSTGHNCLNTEYTLDSTPMKTQTNLENNSTRANDTHTYDTVRHAARTLDKTSSSASRRGASHVQVGYETSDMDISYAHRVAKWTCKGDDPKHEACKVRCEPDLCTYVLHRSSERGSKSAKRLQKHSKLHSEQSQMTTPQMNTT